MTYIVFGYKPPIHESNSGVTPEQVLPVVELYRTESFEEVQSIARSGGLEDERGVFCPITRVENNALTAQGHPLGTGPDPTLEDQMPRKPDASDVVGAAPPRSRRGTGDQPIAKSEFDPSLRNAMGLRPLPQNSRPSRGEQPVDQDKVEKMANDPGVEPRRTIHRSVPGVSKRQDV